MIGIFDSGIGGLSVWRAFQLLSHESKGVYLADEVFMPYGEKSPQFIQQRTRQIISYLIAQGCQVIVIACNTATVTASIRTLRLEFPQTTLVGIEPPLKPLLSKKGHKLLLVTPATAQSDWLYQRLVETQAAQLQIVACPQLAALIEKGELAAAKSQLIQILKPYATLDVKAFGLGCTHYSFIKPVIKTLYSQAEIVDPSRAVAKQIQAVSRQIWTQPEEPTTEFPWTFQTTATQSDNLKRVLVDLLSIDSSVESVHI